MKQIILTAIICFISILTVFSQDTCPNAVDITADLTATCNTIPGPFTFAGDPAGLGDACGAASDPMDAVWFTFTAPFCGLIDVTNTNDPSGTPDTQVQLETGSCGALICTGADDDGGTGFTSAAMGLPIVSGQQYWIEWTDGWGAAPGGFDIRLIEGPCVTPGATDAVVGNTSSASCSNYEYGLAPFTPGTGTPTASGSTITGLTPGTNYTICATGCDPFGDGAALCGYTGNDNPESGNDPVCANFSTIPPVFGCIDPCAPNFDPDANADDGSCEPYEMTCNTDCIMGPFDGVWDPVACECVGEITPVVGCTDPTAENYDPTANCDNGGLCIPEGCTTVGGSANAGSLTGDN